MFEKSERGKQMKQKKKIVISSILWCIILVAMTVNRVYAQNSLIMSNINDDVILEQVKEDVCTIEMGENGVYTKKIISVDNENKEVTMQMDIENFRLNQQETEIFFVIDNSTSMLATTDSGQSRQIIVNGAAKRLARKILEISPNTNIGIIQFSGGHSVLGDASVEALPINDIRAIEYVIDRITAPNSGGTNTDAGLQWALENFSQDKKKIIVLLTDGAPNVCIGNSFSESSVIEKTKQTLQAVINDGINLITVLTKVDEQEIFRDGLTEKQIADQVYGTPMRPYYGSFYYVEDDDFESTVLDSVFPDVKNIIENNMININIADFFPANIVENYDIEITEQPDIGTASLRVDRLSWNIPELKEGEKASLQYKLKLKENYNENIINVETPTNQKVTLSYYKNQYGEEFSKVSPSIILKKQNIENLTPTPIITETENQNYEENEINVPNVENQNNESSEINETNVENQNNVNNEVSKGTEVSNEIADENVVNLKKDNTLVGKKLPQTGSDNIFYILLGALIILTIYICFNVLKYIK